MEPNFKRRSHLITLVGKELEGILSRQMTDRRVNGYPVPSGPPAGRSKTVRSYDISHPASRGIISQSSLDLRTTQPKASLPPRKAGSEKEASNRTFFKQLLDRHTSSRRLSAEDESNKAKVPAPCEQYVPRPIPKFRRAADKFVKPKSTFFVGPAANGTPKPSTRIGADISRPTPSPRRPAQRAPSFQRRSASVDDILSASGGADGNPNLMMFSSDEEDNEESTGRGSRDAAGSGSRNAPAAIRESRPISSQYRTLSSDDILDLLGTEEAPVAKAEPANNSLDLLLRSLPSGLSGTQASGSSSSSDAGSAHGIETATQSSHHNASSSRSPSSSPNSSRSARNSQDLSESLAASQNAGSATDQNQSSSSSVLSQTPSPTSSRPLTSLEANQSAGQESSRDRCVPGPNRTASGSGSSVHSQTSSPTSSRPSANLAANQAAGQESSSDIRMPGAGIAPDLPPSPETRSARSSVHSQSSNPSASRPDVQERVCMATSTLSLDSILGPGPEAPWESRYRRRSEYSVLGMDGMSRATSTTLGIETLSDSSRNGTKYRMESAENPSEVGVRSNSESTDTSDSTTSDSSNSESADTSDSTTSDSSNSGDTTDMNSDSSDGGDTIDISSDSSDSGDTIDIDSDSSESGDSSNNSIHSSDLPSPNSNRDMSEISVTGGAAAQTDMLGELKMNDKVIWFTENGVAETGIVKWLGKIKEQPHAGVEFDNHVGNSSGKIRGKRLFTCALTRGRFVPLPELMLHSDYFEGFVTVNNAPASYRPVLPEERPRVLTAAIVCVICQDPLLNLEEDESEASGSGRPVEEQREMVTTKCGHLFHSTCLTKWFNIKQQKARQPCPYCQHVMDVNDVIRIFPVQGKL